MSMNIFSRCGDKVVFNHPNAGYDHHQKTARKHLVVGKVYTVNFTVVSSWHTDVYLQEVPNVMFNSVLFDDVPKSKVKRLLKKIGV